LEVWGVQGRVPGLTYTLRCEVGGIRFKRIALLRVGKIMFTVPQVRLTLFS